jgi:hypothetical protein
LNNPIYLWLPEYICIDLNNTLKQHLMEILDRALEFEQRKLSFQNTSDRIVASREAKEIILGLNDIYKVNKDPDVMDLMKRLTVIKRKIEVRLKGRSLTS